MTEDPLVKQFLDKVAFIQIQGFWALPLQAARMTFASLAQMAGAKDVPIGRVENIVIKGPEGKLPARIYTPVAAGSGPQPCLLFFHGGGFVCGSLDVYDGFCRMIAEMSGVKVIAVAYRLAPENPFPAAVNDATASLRWLVANAATYKFDVGRIAVGGDSAGGNLAAVTAQWARMALLPVACQWLICPMTHVSEEYVSVRDHINDPILSREMALWFLGKYLPDDVDPTDPRHSPLLEYDFVGLPSAYIVLAGNDPLHDEGLAYAEKLQAANIETTVADYPGMIHDFVFMQSIFPEARTALTAAAEALREMLR